MCMFHMFRVWNLVNTTKDYYYYWRGVAGAHPGVLILRKTTEGTTTEGTTTTGGTTTEGTTTEGWRGGGTLTPNPQVMNP